MKDKSLCFELVSVIFLIIAGSALLLNGLPGWGLISSAGLLAAISFGLRQINNRQMRVKCPVAVAGRSV